MGDMAITGLGLSNSWTAPAAVSGAVSSAPPSSQSLPQDQVQFSAPTGTPQSLDRLAGLKGARQELRTLYDNLSQFKKIPSRTYLITGNSGTGKTPLVLALTSDLQTLGIPTVATTGGQWINGGPQAVQKSFQDTLTSATANPHKTAVLFVDDLDNATRIRDNNPSPEASRNAELLATFADQMEKAAARDDVNVLVIGATSAPASMDWMASHKFQRTITLEAPANAGERLEVLNKLIDSRQLKVSSEALEELAGGTGGKTPFQLENILERAQALSGSPEINDKQLREARLEAAFGAAKPVTADDWMFKLSVSHELGHAVIRELFDQMAQEQNRPDERPLAIDCLSFVPRDGTSASVALKYNGNPTKTFPYYFAEICSNYGGRAAEYLFGNGHVSAGPGNDIKFATTLADEAIKQSGMGASLGPVNPDQTKNLDFNTRAQSDQQKLLEAADRASMAVVYFYADFITTTAEQFLSNKNDTSALVWSGKEFTTALRAWEQADPQRQAALQNLKKYVREQYLPLQPKLPLVFDAASGTMIPADQAAAKLKSTF